MRRDEDEVREKRKRTIIGVIIAAVMVLSTFGFVLEFANQNGAQAERHNGIKFEQAGNGVIATIEGNLINFPYFPSQVATLPVDPQAADLLRTVPTFYLTSDPKDPYAQSIDETALYLTEILPGAKQVYPLLAFTNSTGYTRQQISCANATQSVPVIFMHRSNRTEVTLRDGCIDVAAQTQQDMYRLGERVLFIALGVLDE